MYRKTKLSHLLLRPSVIFVGDASAEVTDVGVGEMLRRKPPKSGWGQNSPYAAPELRDGAPGPGSDQFSLALIYLEMTQAWSPTPGQSAKGISAALTLDRLTDPARRVIRKALHPEPASRFASGVEFVAALRSTIYPDGLPQAVLDDLPPVITMDRLTGRAEKSAAISPLGAVVQAVTLAACPPDSPYWVGNEPVQLPDETWMCRFPVNLAPGMIELKIRMLQDQLRFEVSQPNPSTYLLTRYRRGGLWGSLRGKKAGIELILRLPEGDPSQPGDGDAELAGRLVGPEDLNPSGVADEALPAVIAKVRRTVQNVPNRRRSIRVPSQLPVLIYPVNDDGEVLPPIACRGRDLSAGGYSCIAPVPVPTTVAYVAFGGVDEYTDIAVLSQVVRTLPLGEGELMVAGQFAEHL